MTVQPKRKAKPLEKLLPSSIQLCKLTQLITNKQTNQAKHFSVEHISSHTIFPSQVHTPNGRPN